VKEPYSLLDVKEGQIRPYDWILIFNSSHTSQLAWFQPDFVVEVPSSDVDAYLEEYPFQAVQATPPSAHSMPPFKLDKNFTIAFKRAIKNYEGEHGWNDAPVKASSKFLDLISSNMPSND
jgi:hypothetical protein